MNLLRFVHSSYSGDRSDRHVVRSTYAIRIRSAISVVGILALALPAVAKANADAMPEPVAGLFGRFCADCHSDGAAEGGFSFQTDRVSWTASEHLHDWENAHERITRSLMPPPDADQPTDQQRKVMSKWLDANLRKHGPVGGTGPRRLNRREYRNTVRQLFGMDDYEVPASFPADSTDSGFDNHAASLVLAGSHLEAYADASVEIADTLFPPARQSIESRHVEVSPEDLVISYSSACLVDGAMRLGSSGTNFRRHATWPTRFEAPASGVYRVEVQASALNPPPETPQLNIGVMPLSTEGDVESVTSLKIDSARKKSFSVELKLNKGDTVVLRYANGPFDYDDADRYQKFLHQHLTRHPEIAAAWDSLGKVARGGSGWQRVKEAIANKELDVDSFRDNPEAIARVVKTMAGNKVSSGETLVYQFFEQGPNIGIHGLSVTGPLRPIRDRDEIRSEKLRTALTGKDFDPSDDDSLRRFLARILSEMFRRPATKTEVDGYIQLVRLEAERTGDTDAGMHLALRAALLAPEFLYRSIGDGPLNDYALATRLSYFLRSSPPDAQAKELLAEGHYSSADVLRKETIRLVDKEFAADFTRQWLDLDFVATVMPDARLGKFTERHRKTILAEPTDTFWFLWQKNRSITEFIDPEFVFTDAEVGWDIYQLDQFSRRNMSREDKRRKNRVSRVDVPRGGRHGGLLNMAAVMIATANGVDTQPVLRGVWLMENILGTPPPEPPDSVPALTPDTSLATTVRQRLAAHMSEQSCAVCHREIDPLGFALENFDPVGRWRTTYPNFRSDQAGTETQAVDATGVLPDGTPIRDITDLKRWLASHPEKFACCLSEKLMAYATGRDLSYREKRLIEEIVRNERENNYRFRDLLIALVQSDVFRMQ